MKLDLNERSDFASSWLNELQLNVDSLWQYPLREPIEQLIADNYNQQWSLQLTADNIFCSNGGDESIYILMRVIKEQSKIILPLPAFSQYTQGIESWQLDSIQIPPKDDLSIDLDALKNAIQETPNSIAVVTSPNNPTGELLDLTVIESLLTLAQSNSSWIFLDEAYIEFSDQPSAIELLKRFDNLVLLRTLSKAYGLAGIRFGYLIGSSRLISQFKQRAMPFNVPALSLQIASATFQTKVQDDVTLFIERIKANRSELTGWFKNIGLSPLTSQANFLLIPMSEQLCQLATTALAQQGIQVRQFNDQYLKNCIRITIPYYLNRLVDGLQKVFAPELLCFDMDGVLINTSESYDQAIIKTVYQFTQKTVTLSDILNKRRSGGFNNDWVLSHALINERSKQSIALDSVIEYFQSVYLGNENTPGLISNEKIMVASELNNQLEALPIAKAIVTGRPRFEAEIGLKQLSKTSSVWNDFKLISTDDVQQCKPSPEGILNLKERFNVSRSWMIGDTPDDMQAAIDSNSIAIGIGLENADKLRSSGASLVLEDINQLTALLPTAATINKR